MKKLATRIAQYPLYAEFAFTFNEWVVDSVDGTKKTLGSTVVNSTDAQEPLLTGPVANTIVFDCINMPPYAVITGGELITETAYIGCTAATVSLGIAGSTTALLNASSIMAAAGTRVALTMTAPMLANAGQNLRATIAYTVANATAGKARLRVQYTIDGRGGENATG
mgnify:CR=1 FL=1